VFNKIDKGLVNKINNAIYASGKMTNSSEWMMMPFIKSLIPGRLSTGYYEFRGVNYILDIQKNQMTGAVGAAIMIKNYKDKVIIINTEALPVITGMLNKLGIEPTTSNIEMFKEELYHHECGHHIRGPLSNVSRFSTLEDLGKIYVDEEIAVNNEVGSDTYTKVLHKIVNEGGYAPFVQGGIMGVSFLTQNTMTDTLSLIKNNIDWFLNNAGQPWVDSMEKGLKIKINTGR